MRDTPALFAILGVGITIGIIITLLLIYIIGATPTGVEIAGVAFDFPAPASTVRSTPLVPGASSLPETSQPSTKNSVEPLTPLPTHTPTLIPATDTPMAPTPIPTNTPIPPTATPTEVVCSWAVQAFNATDPSNSLTIIVNGSEVVRLPDDNGLMQDSDWINISSRLARNRENIVRLRAYGTVPVTWGFRIRLGDKLIVEEVNGDTSTSKLTSGAIFDRTYILAPECEYRQLLPTGDTWAVNMSVSNWAGAGISIDGYGVCGVSGRELSGSCDISEWILQGRSHVFSIGCSDLASMNGGGLCNYTFQRNGQTVLTRDVSEWDQALKIYLSMDGRLSFDRP